MGGREIQLDGGEITILKALGIGSSSEVSGEDLMTKVSADFIPAELIDTLKDLIMVGYVEADKSAFYNVDEFKAVNFRVNPGYSKDLREAINPQRQAPKSRRVRRE